MKLVDKIQNIILDMDAYDGRDGHADSMIAADEIMEEIYKALKYDQE